MSNKLKIMFCVTLIIFCLSISAIIFIQIPVITRPKVYDFSNVTVENQNTISHQMQTNQNTTMLAETVAQDEEYFDTIKFVGDSRTNAMKLFGIDEKNIFAEDGINHQTALTKEFIRLSENKTTTLYEALRITAPEVVMLNFGINGLSWMSIEDFIYSYEKLVDQVVEASPSSIVVINSVLPVSLAYEQRLDGVLNSKIDEANGELYSLAEKKGLYYMGMSDILKNSHNALKDEYHNGDGLHFNSSTYTAIKEYILTHAIYKIRG